jgi:hypothetical protein
MPGNFSDPTVLENLASLGQVLRQGLVPIDDEDGDSIRDANDNCKAVADANQRDTDGDGYGNFCDGDLNNDGIVNSLDLGLFKQRFLTTNADADLNGDGTVNSLDLGLFKGLFLKPPGPSGLVL